MNRATVTDMADSPVTVKISGTMDLPSTFAAPAQTCPACGAMNASSASYCSSCGSPMEDDGDEMPMSATRWEGILGVEGAPTSDKRLLIPEEIGERDLPLVFMAQPATAGGHEGALDAGSIDAIEHIPIADFERAEEFNLVDLPEKAVVIWGEGTFNDTPAAEMAKRLIEEGAGVSLDIPHSRLAPFDPETLEEIDQAELGLEALFAGDYLTGIAGKIAGATIVSIAAFEEARVKIADGSALVASAYGIRLVPDKNDAFWYYIGPEGEEFEPTILLASAGPVKPPIAWFEDPHMTELTPLTITKEGRVYGHLADWNGCHIGFQGICVPPFQSPSNYAYFNVGEIETAEGKLVPCGKIMFSRDGVGHADTDPRLTYADVMRHYDDATSVGAFVRAGSDRFGTWLAGAIRSDLSELEIQHLRSHPPSGDWRPVRGRTDLVAAFSVPVGGFPIPRRALVASADGGITAIISAPLTLTEEDGRRRRRLDKAMLTNRMREALGMKEKTRAAILEETLATLNEGPWLDDFAISAEDRRRYAKSGVALPDGSFPIPDCDYAMRAVRAQGRTGGSQARVVAHIRKRVRALGCTNVPDQYR